MRTFTLASGTRAAGLSRVLVGPAVVVMLALAPDVAGETIRVAILQEADVVSLAAPHGVVLRGAAGEDLRAASGQSLSVAAHATDFLVDGRRLPTERLEAQGRNGELVVNGMVVAGRLNITRNNGKLLVVNTLDLEDYLKGVVPAEMSASWHPEALKAQAIAARTYALFQMRQKAKRAFDVAATTKDQVYRGRAGANGPAGRAVEQTRDLVLTYRGAPIFAAYHSTAAGFTEDALHVWSLDLPYLKGVECPFDTNSPYYQWRTDVALPLLERRLNEEGFPVGVIATLTPAAHSKSGRVKQVRILHSDGELYLRGEDLRRVLGYTVLASTQFALELSGLKIQFTGRGAGHGVGLCQWGAKELAEQGYRAEAILEYYYPGTELRPLTRLSPR